MLRLFAMLFRMVLQLHFGVCTVHAEAVVVSRCLCLRYVLFHSFSFRLIEILH